MVYEFLAHPLLCHLEEEQKVGKWKGNFCGETEAPISPNVKCVAISESDTLGVPKTLLLNPKWLIFLLNSREIL